MIRLIETKNYRSLKYIHRELDNFQILVGPNASGKTTFLDVVQFISDIISEGIDKAITKRSANFNDLTFSGVGDNIELAMELILPRAIADQLHNKYETVRYEIRIGLNAETAEHEIKEENVLFVDTNSAAGQPKFVSGTTGIFPGSHTEPKSIFFPGTGERQYIICKGANGTATYYYENDATFSPVPFSFASGMKKSALGNMPFDEQLFPAAIWLKEYITEGIQAFVLDSSHIRKASPPGQSKKFKTDGSNLPWVINDLTKHPIQFKNWIKHLRTALPDIETIDTIEREDDKHRYLRIKYNNGITVPSWLVSNGTLRLLALTLPAYLPDFSGVYLIEEPENGIHPKAIETVYQSLSSVYNAQILLATHSTVLLSLVKPEEILCFAKTDIGSTDIVKESQHPELKSWKGKVNLGLLFAGGVLG